MAVKKYWKISLVVMVSLVKYWIYHSWPSATRGKINIFTRDYHNHSWYFPILFHSHAWFLQYIDFYLFIMKIFQFSMKISIIRLEKRGGKVLLTHTNIISNFKCWNWCWNKTCFSAIRSLISSFWPAKKKILLSHDPLFIKTVWAHNFVP